MNIVVLDAHALNPGDLSWEPLSQSGHVTIYPRTSADQVLARCASAQIVITNKVPFSAERLAQLPDLKLIAVTATGYNIIDTAAAAARGVLVCNVPAYSTHSVAQMVFAHLLELASHVGLHDRLVHEGAWVNSPDFTFWKKPLIELAGKTIGIIGFGQIGRQVGQIAHAFGMKVLANNRSRTNAPSYSPFAWAEIDEILRTADVISLHAPQTPQTTHLINATTLALMKPTAFLINTARGGLVHEADLAAALNAGQIAAAALDVLTVEPPPPNNPLLTAKNCLITPHFAWATNEARQRCMAITVANVTAFVAGQPQNVVNLKA